MNERPLVLKGNIKLNSDYLIGKIIKNKHTEEKCNSILVLDDEHLYLYEEGYKAYIFDNIPKNINLKDINYCYQIEKIDTLIDHDVIEIINNDVIKVLYRDDSDDNAIVVTNQCNSNCIMCPDSDFVRNTKDSPYIEKLLEQVRYTPSDTKFITITGGEVGLLKDNLVRLLSECKEYLNDTEFLILTNGRVFSNTEFCNKVCNNLPSKIRFAIPIYADNEKLHDEITRAKGSFKQTIIGIKKLISRNIDIEIRIVVQKKNYKFLNDIAKFIVKELPNVKMVNFMGLEMLGNSIRNKEQVWVNYLDFKDYLYNAALTIIKEGIMVNLYNFPLCNLDKRLYGLATKSITDYKVKYKEECNNCKAKDTCGGFFFSTINMKDIKVKPIE